MGLALIISERTSCKFYAVGVVAVDKNKRIISLGYNGSSEGDDHCIDVGCAKVDGVNGVYKRCRGIHAEINSIINSSDTTRLKGATIYTTLFPCYDCMKALNNVGISEIVYMEEYQRIKIGGKGKEEETESIELARKRKIKIRKYNLKEIEINIKR